MRKKELEDLFSQYKNRKNRLESDCNVVNRVWILYRHTDDAKVRRRAVTWFIQRLEDKTTNMLVLSIIYQHLYHERRRLTHKHLRRFRKSLKKMPRKVRSNLKSLR